MDNSYDRSLMAETRTGTFVGKRNDKGTIVFRGVPYGKFTGRWKPLERLPDSDAVCEAYDNGPICPQIKYLDWYPQAEFEVKDETACNHLAVATSDVTGKKPVFVFIHGGANVTGGYFDKRYDPQHFVDQNPDVVFVVFNYRLGILGTLYLGDLTDDPDYQRAGNITLCDQLAAFQWVHENIAAFGGDPDNITIGGRSSGSVSTTLHMCIPESWHYWNNAFCQSGSTYFIRPNYIEDAKLITKQVMEYLGVSTLDELLALPPETLLTVDAQKYNITFTADGIILPLDLNPTLCEGEADCLLRGKNILIGSTSGDMDLGILIGGRLEESKLNAVNASLHMVHNLTEEELGYYTAEYFPSDQQEAARSFLKNMTVQQMSQIFDRYLNSDPNRDPYFAMSDCLNDFCFEYPLSMVTRGLCKHNTVYRYLWTWGPKEIYPLRAFHGIDAAFVLNTQSEEEIIAPYFQQPETIHMFEVAQEIIHAFICEGKPTYHSLQPIRYDPDSKPVMIVDTEPHYENDPRKDDCVHMQRIFQQQLS